MSQRKTDTNPETIRKRNSKNNETDEQHKVRKERDRERKRKKKAEETEEDRKARLARLSDNRQKKKSEEKSVERRERLDRENERKRIECVTLKQVKVQKNVLFHHHHQGIFCYLVILNLSKLFSDRIVFR